MKIITYAYRQDLFAPKTPLDFLTQKRLLFALIGIGLLDFALGRILFGVLSNLGSETGGRDDMRYWMKCVGHALEYMPIFATCFFVTYKGFKQKYLYGNLLVIGPIFLASVCGEIYRDTPYIYGCLLYFTAWPVLYWWLKNDRELIQALGIDPLGIRIGALYGVIGGLILGGHLFFVLNVTKGYVLEILPFPLWVETMSFEFGINAFCEELFYRGLIFRKFLKRGWGFWTSTFLSTTFYIVRYFADPRFLASPEVAVGGIFYLGLISVIACSIYRRTGSIVGPVLMNVTISMVFYSCQNLNY